MKLFSVLAILAIMILTSCAQHVCPTYANSGRQWHKHNPHPTTHHH